MAKLALLIGVSQYEPEAGLAPLPSALKDVQALYGVLSHPEMGGFDEDNIVLLENPDRQTMEEAIETLFSNRNRDDLVVLFFSGHGIKDDTGKLYFSSCKTYKTPRGELRRSTAVSASFVQDSISRSRSRRQVIILDCCFSGAFAEGLSAKDDGSVDVATQLGGEGRAVLTSSTSTQYSFEHETSDLSIYTRYLIEGIQSGAADDDGDGKVAIDELHEYAKRKVQETSPAMKPEIYTSKEGFRIFLSQAPANDPKLKYRREVERVADRGAIYGVARKTLDWQRIHLGLLEEEANIIEDEVLRPHREYRHNLQQYEQVFLTALQREYPINKITLKDLKRYQEVLGLRDEDVAPLEEKAIELYQEVLGLRDEDVAPLEEAIELWRSSPEVPLHSATPPGDKQHHDGSSNYSQSISLQPVSQAPQKGSEDDNADSNSLIHFDAKESLTEGLNSDSNVAHSAEASPAHKKRFFNLPLIVGCIGVLGIVVSAGGVRLYQHFQSVREMQSRLHDIQTLQEQGNYQDCEIQARQIPSSSNFFETARELEAECRNFAEHQKYLDTAQDYAARESYVAAIQEASKIPETSPVYDQAQPLIPSWAQTVIDAATTQYEQHGRKDEAVEWLNRIPEYAAPAYEKAQTLISQWQQSWDLNVHHQGNAIAARDARQLNTARNEANQIDISTPFWRGEQAAILSSIEQIEAQIRAEEARRQEEARKQAELNALREQVAQQQAEDDAEEAARARCRQLRAEFNARNPQVVQYLGRRGGLTRSQCAELGVVIGEG